jgi:hypothetical protein
MTLNDLSPRPERSPCAIGAIGTICLCALLALSACSGTTEAKRQADNSTPPPTDCTAWVGTDRNAMLPGYLLPGQGVGSTVCVPLLLTANPTPASYAGGDYHISEFTDDKLKARWRACKEDAPASSASTRRCSAGCRRTRSAPRAPPARSIRRERSIPTGRST